jgi:hypothetical protein
VISGWLVAGGTQIVNSGDRPFKEAEGSRRSPIVLRGSPTIDVIARMPGPTGPVGIEIRYFAIFDKETSGYPLAYFRATPPFTTIPNDVPQWDAMVFWDLPVLLSINSSLLSGGTSELLEPGRGDRLGVINGQTVFAGAKLQITAGRIITRVSALRRPVAVEASA